MRKRLVVEIRRGADLHGQDAIQASGRSVRDAIGGSCLCGPREILPLPRLEYRVVGAGLTIPTLLIEQLGDKNEGAGVALAAVPASVDVQPESSNRGRHSPS